MAKIKMKALTQEELLTKIEMVKANIEKVKAVPGLETVVADFETELAELEGLKVTSNVVNKAELFAQLFAQLEGVNNNPETGEVTEFTDEQKAFIGEGITVKLLATGKFEYVKKAGTGGGIKSPMPYTEFLIPFEDEGVLKYEHFTKASAAAGLVKAGETAHPHSVIELLKNQYDTVIKLAEGDSMRREIVKLNKKYKLGIRVTLLEDGTTIDLLDSKHETAYKPETEEDTTEPAETESAE